MDKNSKENPKAAYDLGQVRGIITNRGIAREEFYGRTIGGVFDLLGLTIDELRGKKILDVGTGGGRTLDESRRIGLDITGVDISPVISTVGQGKLVSDKRMIEVAQSELRTVAETYPGSIVGSDATVALPFKDNSFDIVLSHLGLPGYSRSPKELATSILEMIRVAKERVVITGKSFEEGDSEGVSEVGTGGSEFNMAYKKFLDFLTEKYGIKIKVIPRTPLMALPSFDFDVTGKLSNKLKDEEKQIIQEAERLKR